MDRILESAESAAAAKSQTKLSFSERNTAKEGPQPAVHLVDGNHVLRPIDRAPPGDIVRKTSKSQSKADLTRRKSKKDFFEDAFAVYPGSPVRERVHGDAIVMAEIKTNVIIRDEFTFITELSYQLSTRYQRPVSSIVVTLQHGTCMFFGGSFDPAYVMAMFALPSQLLPTTNKRNAALIQRHMQETLGVSPTRGLLRFVPVQEEHLACNGKTMAGEIEELERGFCESGGDGRVVMEPSMVEKEGSRAQRARKKMSVKSLATLRLPPKGAMPTPETTPPTSAGEGSPRTLYPITDADVGPGVSVPPQPKRAQRKKSFVAAIFGRSSSKASARPSSAVTPDEQ